MKNHKDDERLEYFSFELRVRGLGLTNVEERILRVRILSLCTSPSREGGTRLFPVVSSERKNDHKLQHKRIPVNVRKHFFTVKVTKH